MKFYSAVMLCVLVLAGCSAPAPAVDTDVLVPFALDADFADPAVLEVDGTFYAYATQGNGVNIQVATSPDLATWTLVDTDALPQVPAWSTPGDTWAPDVSFVGGQFVMFFTTTNTEPLMQCIGVATSATPTGPFEAVGTAPIVCPVDEGGAIDPATFVDDDGSRYLLFKNDGNCCGLDTWISIAPLSADSLSLAGEPARLIQQDQPWEGRLVEAPTLVKHDGNFVLLYSANDYNSLDYAIGYATSPSLLGPYSKGPGPLLGTDASDYAYYGPGGQDVVGDTIVFHSWNAEHTHRGLNVAPLHWNDGVPSVVLPRPVD